MKTIFVKPLTFEKKWYLINAEGHSLGKVAVTAARILRGKNKPEFANHHDLGDYVIIVNADKVKLTGNKYTDKLYHRHTGYIGGLKTETYAQVVKKHPTRPMEKAVKGMLPKGPLGNKLYTKVKVYAGLDHPHAAQQPIVVEL